MVRKYFQVNLHTLNTHNLSSFMYSLVPTALDGSKQSNEITFRRFQILYLDYSKMLQLQLQLKRKQL